MKFRSIRATLLFAIVLVLSIVAVQAQSKPKTIEAGATASAAKTVVFNPVLMPEQSAILYAETVKRIQELRAALETEYLRLQNITLRGAIDAGLSKEQINAASIEQNENGKLVFAPKREPTPAKKE